MYWAGVITVVLLCACLYLIGSILTPLLRAKPVSNSGFSPSQLQKLPSIITVKGLFMGFKCAICLDGIATDQPARLVSCCNHAFHVECADTWLFKHSTCPLCRAKLDLILLFS
ncbi:E3 ubiquitin-protein ligase ATL23-like [Vigna radiata var. radiata]|uniref:E3 ubiquitin-protein ligase ATL23-like n=1 Tax=Vigna radiata var. radiata TaxID=3916 RepID=A0A1S3VG50_VIGRR|nr:E3 ubiquitin-protein ligase ATL23-like [Vigna radiata var. radiata]